MVLVGGEGEGEGGGHRWGTLEKPEAGVVPSCMPYPVAPHHNHRASAGGPACSSRAFWAFHIQWQKGGGSQKPTFSCDVLPEAFEDSLGDEVHRHTHPGVAIGCESSSDGTSTGALSVGIVSMMGY